MYHKKLPFPKFFGRPHFDIFIKFIEISNLVAIPFFAAATYKAKYEEILISRILIDY